MFQSNWTGIVAALALLASPVAAQDRFPVQISVDADAVQGQYAPVWRFFGADEVNYATMKDGRALLTELGKLRPGQVYFRAHNLLTTGDGTPALKWGSTNAYTEDADGNPVYNWTIMDRIFDTYLARGIKPYVEIGFMPEALSTNPHPYQHNWRPGSGDLKAGWAYPPRDWAKWEELIYQWVLHCVERYGAEEVSTWYWQTWNEANLPQYYWGGTREEFFKLHEVSVRAVRRALPTARVGGPDNAGARDDFMTAFMDYMQATNTPTDFLAFHAKGQPEFIETPEGGYVRMGLSTQLKAADHEFAAIAAHPAFKDKPVIIGEFDPEGCAACQGPANAYRNGTVFASYVAASFTRVAELAKRRDINLEGVLSWAFTFEDQRYFAGFRQLASNGIDLPVLNVFRMFALMPEQQLAASSDHQVTLDAALNDGVRGPADVGVLATRDDDTIAILVWHYHDEDIAGPVAAISLDLTDLPADWRSATVTHYRVDDRHSNSYAAYLKMGSPLAPDNAQYAALKDASRLTTLNSAPQTVTVTKGAAELPFDLPRQGVSLILLQKGA